MPSHIITRFTMTSTTNKTDINASSIDFQDTAVAFAYKTGKELKKTEWLFSMMQNPRIVKLGNTLAIKAIKWNLPFAQLVIKNTIFKQFCGGTTLLETSKALKTLSNKNVQTVLDYGVEAKDSEEDFNRCMVENMRAIDFARQIGNVPFVVIKITGLLPFDLLEKLQTNAPLTNDENATYFNGSKRIDAICNHAREKKIKILIDAEESWVQDSIDRIANMMMSRYNKDSAVVYNTYQFYRHDRLDFLKKSFESAQEKNYFLGAKLVRGAYMEKERTRAEKMNYKTPINPDKISTDSMYNDALLFCVSNYERIACMNATHNAQSTRLLVDVIEEMKIPKNHPHFYFCQLFGMSDNLTFNLAKAGYNVAKYVVYGSVHDVVPYLMRRAQENTSVTGDAGRELTLVRKELNRRKI